MKVAIVGIVACGGRPAAQASDGATRSWAVPPASEAPDESRTLVQEGLATFYGEALRGHKTANGERFDPDAYTCAHRTLPFGTEIEVERVETGQRVVVRVNDRGPWGDDRRIVDLSKHAAHDLDMIRAGVVRVRLKILRMGEPASSRAKKR